MRLAGLDKRAHPPYKDGLAQAGCRLMRLVFIERQVDL
jgi:hypothetical protein